MELKNAGRSIPRVDGRAKVTGEARYAADVHVFGAAHARLLLSPHAAARITGYDLAAAAAAPGVLAVVTGRDLPELPGTALDQPLARDEVRYDGQPVVAVVAESEAAAADAVELAGVDYEPLEPVLDLAQATDPAARPVLDRRPEIPPVLRDIVPVLPEQPDHLPPNVGAEVVLRHGDVESGLRASRHVVRGTWTTPMAHQGALEPHVALARWDDGDGVTIWTSTQGPVFVQAAVQRALGLDDPQQVRVLPMTLGGGFGGKSGLLEPLVALLARRLGRPVRLVLTRSEVFQMGRQGVGGVVEIELGADEGGRLLALRTRVHFDGGIALRGYAGLGSLLASNTYRVPAYEFLGSDVLTNRTPVSPYRAPNAPVIYFALESAMDELARAAGLDPIELRLLNASREGDHRAGHEGPWPELGLVQCLEAARRHPAYTDPLGPDEAVGVAVGLWPAHWSPAAALCTVEPDGQLRLSVGYIDMTGTDTAMAAMAADAFGVGADRVRLDRLNTAVARHPGSSGGSRTTYSVGPAVIEAARDLRRQVVEVAADRLEAAPEDLVIEDGRVFVAGVPARSIGLDEVVADSRRPQGRHAPLVGRGRVITSGDSPLSTVHVARVRVDRETGEWRVVRYLAVQDVGRAINPAEVQGQIHGGALQSVGRALGEAMRWDESGTLLTASFVDYPLPSIDQALPIEVELVELASPYGPLGAKGVGEPPAIPGPAAIANAIRGVTGRRSFAVPIEWEAVWAAPAGLGGAAAGAG